MENIKLTPEMVALVSRVVSGELVLVGDELVVKPAKVKKGIEDNVEIVSLVKEFIERTQGIYTNKTCYFSIKVAAGSLALLDAVFGKVECDRDRMLRVVNDLVKSGYLVKVGLKDGQEIPHEVCNNFQVRYKLAPKV